MKKLLAILPAVALAFTGCGVSSSDEVTIVVSSSSTAQSSSGFEKISLNDQIVYDMGEFAYTNGVFEVTKGLCTSEANHAVWKKVPKTGSLTDNLNGSAEVDLGEGKSTYYFNVEESFPNGTYYKASTLKDPLVLGFVLDDPYYDDVVFVNNECIFQYFGEMKETFADIAEVRAEFINVKCNELDYGGLAMKYVAHTDTSIDYDVSYGSMVSRVHQGFRYAFNEADCNAAFDEYQKEYEDGETEDLFDFNRYDQRLHADENFTDLIIAYNNNAALAKKAEISEKDVLKLLRAAGSSIRRAK
jgi:hypothetical protein